MGLNTYNAGTPWDSNFYEMMINSVMPLWALAKEEGLLDPERYLKTSQPPANDSSSFLLIQARNETYESRWNYTFDYMTPKRALMEEASILPIQLYPHPKPTCKQLGTFRLIVLNSLWSSWFQLFIEHLCIISLHHVPSR